MWGSGVIPRVLLSSTCRERIPYLDSRRKSTRTSKRVEDCEAGKRRYIQNHQDRSDFAISSSRRPHILPKGKDGCIFLDSWRYAWYSQKYHRTPSKRRSKEEACLVETKSICSWAKQSHHGRSRQALSNRFYPRGLLPKMAS